MSKKIDQKEYLKKYLSGDKVKKKKKKDKKHKSSKVVIIDDDCVESGTTSRIDEELLLTGDDAPQIVGAYVEELLNGQKENKWRSIAIKDEPEDEDKDGDDLWGKKAAPPVKDENQIDKSVKIKREPRGSSAENSDHSPPRKRAQSPVRRRSRSPDQSPPRRRGSDQSPPRRRAQSPPQRRRSRTPDQSPPRRRAQSPSHRRRSRSSDQSPPRRRGSDQSPRRRRGQSPRRRRSRTPDQSPPRRRGSDQSPPRRRGQSSPKRRRSRSSDQSPPRRRDQSPPHRRRSPDQSPPRRHNRNAVSPSPERRHIKKEKDADPRRNEIKREPPSPGQRKSRWAPPSRSPSPPPTHKPTATKTLDGKTAGLQNAQALVAESEERRRREDRLYEEMSKDVSGRDAEVQVRSTRRLGRRAREAANEDPEVKRRREEREQQKQQLYDRWGKGLKQIADHESRRAELDYESSKPLARAKDDEDLERHLREQERLDDPMLQYMREKKKQQRQESGLPTMPEYQGSFPENRFGIRPGYRWDGVDRSNGYEKKWFDVRNEKRALQDDAYKYSVEDM